MAVTDPTLVQSMITVISHLRRKDAGDGTIEAISNEDGIARAVEMWEAYHNDFAETRNIEEPTNSDYAKVIFLKLRQPFIEARYRKSGGAATEEYKVILDAANSTAAADIAATIADPEALQLQETEITESCPVSDNGLHTSPVMMQ